METVTKGIIYFNTKNSPVLFKLESPNSSFQVISVFQNIQNFNKSDYNEVDHKHISQKNRYRIAFSIAKTAINIALENNKDAKLVWLLKDFIAASQKEHEDDIDEAKESISTKNYDSKQN
ncbi:protein far1-related sequence 5-like isoform x2 [Gigaspora margarita]|uniref:Protein far1-related sequence 5-like isoform x2 n=1 Tax=Gigaspora margarita TaxID=4874 RepID=A0A8H4AG02_GIGMA|nr:protein far1-related sequence 5-like isoform x2 [Gigaspora margarita]